MRRFFERGAMLVALAMMGAVQAGTGTVIRSEAIEAEFADTSSGFPSSNVDRLDRLYWTDHGGVRSDNFVQLLPSAATCSDSAGFAGQTLAVPTGSHPLVIGPGSLSSELLPSSATALTVASSGLLCGGAADAPALSSYRVFPGDASRRNLLRVLRTVSFDTGTRTFEATALRTWTPRVPLAPYHNVLVPSASGATIRTTDASACSGDCVQSDWNGRWYAMDDGNGRGIAVIRSPFSESPAQLVIRNDAFASNLTAIALLQPASGWREPITEVEYLCFYDASSWTAQDRAAGRLPQGCATEPLTHDFGRATGASTYTSKTSRTLVPGNLSGPTPIVVYNGLYRLNGGSLTSAPGTLNPGDSVTLVGYSSGSALTTAQQFVEIGGQLGLFEIDSTSVDTTPDGFDFGEVTGVPVSSTQISVARTLTGFNSGTPISISGRNSAYSVNGGAFTTASGTVSPGSQVRVRLTAGTTAGSRVFATMTIGRTTGRFDVVTAGGVSDTTPTPFSFAAVTGAVPGSIRTSNAVTISGITAPASVSITGGGTYSIDGGAWTSAPGQVSNGQTISLQQTAAATADSSSTSTLTVGGISASWTVMTASADTTPDEFSFTAVTQAVPGSLQTSNLVAVTGIDAPADLALVGDGASYSIDGGSWTSGAGTIGSGQTVALRMRAPDANGASAGATLTIGGVSASWTVSTPSVDTTPDAFGFVPVNGATPGSEQTSDPTTISGINAPAAISLSGVGSYSINGGVWTRAPGQVRDGDAVALRMTAPASAGASAGATLTVGSISAAWSVSTVGVDTTPDAFGFSSIVNASPGSELTSALIVVSGINALTPVSIAGGGRYSINGGPWTSAAGQVENGQTVALRLTAPASPGASLTTTLTIGGVSAGWSVSTIAVDTVPDAFAFPPAADAPGGSVQTSDAVTISGTNAPAAVSISGAGSYRIDGGAWTSADGQIASGQTISLRLTAVASGGGSVGTTLTIGGVSATWTVFTANADTSPDAFSFPPASGVAIGSVQTSSPATINGITAPAAVSITGAGSYSIAGGAWTTAAGQIGNGQTIALRLTAAGSAGSTVSTTVTIGGVSATWTVGTAGTDVTPDAFSFPPVTDAVPGSVQISSEITVAGTNAPSQISIGGRGEYSIDDGPWKSNDATVQPGAVIALRLTAPTTYGASASTKFNVGGVSSTWVVSTSSTDTVPDNFSFAPLVNVDSGSVQTSNTVTISGISTAVPISIAGGGASYRINSGVWTTAAGQVSNGQTVTLRMTAAASSGVTVNTTLTVGGISAGWSVMTVGNDSVPDAFSFAPVTDASPGSLQTSGMVTVGGIDAPASISIAGGGATYSINGGAWTSAAGQVSSGQSVVLRLNASTIIGTNVSTTLTIGGIRGTWTVSTALSAPGPGLIHWGAYGKLTLPIDTDGRNGADEIEASELDNYSSIYFYKTTAGQRTASGYSAASGETVFWAPVDGGATTSSAKYVRSEMREQISLGNDRVNWPLTGTHIQSGTVTITQLPTPKTPGGQVKTVFAQIHGVEVTPPIKLQFSSSSSGPVIYGIYNFRPETSGGDSSIRIPAALGQSFTYEIKMVNGVLTTKINGQLIDTRDLTSAWRNETFYFKAGNYVQNTPETATGAAEVVHSSLSVSHN